MSNTFDLSSNCIYEQNWDDCQFSNKLNNDSYDYQQQNLQAQQSTLTSSSQGSPVVKKKKQKNSSSKDSNPNLLKNLVVTLRSWVQIKEGNNDCSRYEVEIWNHFKKSKKINKYLVWTLYGSIKDDPQQFQKIGQILPMLKKIDISQYQKMQENIKKQTLQQLKKADVNYILKYRRVKDREQFNNYFNDFVKKLEKGQSYSKKIKQKQSSN